ncbi:hypothetical protein [Gelidibacter sp. F63206]|jgi:hypothetical protein|uniref:hypothetical protein n=1 Tax=Gelidibacter sp. F63206 TaxID=2926425 RepID=UPI001FF55039|nr:hypothetical protein [Gelidibacter sp. F63206]MCK0114662.1 hypothetical protein [Gelidibacter sp. F63206]
MEKSTGFPKNYKRLQILDVCSNKIIGGGSVMGIDNFAPLLIGDGNLPKVWLYAKVSKNSWTPLIVENESLHTDLHITINEQEREVIIKIKDVIILNVVKIEDGHCEIRHLELRPIGLNLYGNQQALRVANSTFAGNIYNGISFMVGFTDQVEKELESEK